MLGDRLRVLRENKHMTQEQVAKALEITRPGYTQYEIGARKPDPETLAKLAKLFDVSIDWIVTGVTPEDSGVSPEEEDFLRWVDDNLDDVFFYDFHKSADEQKKQFMETMKALWEVEKRRGNIKPKE